MLSTEFGLRRGVLGDLAGVLAVERGCAEVSHWSEAVWRGVLAQGVAEREVWVAERGGVVVGFAVAGLVAEFAEMEAVAVAAEVRRMGVARALCEAALRWAAERSATGMELEVRAANVAAISLYAGLGFVEQGRRRGYYRDPVDDAVMMRLAIAG